MPVWKLILVAVGWIISLVVCYYATRSSSRKGYVEKDAIYSDTEIRPSTTDMPIGRIFSTILLDAERYGADTILFEKKGPSGMWIKYFREGELVKLPFPSLTDEPQWSEGMPLPTFIAQALFIEAIVNVEESRKRTSELEMIREHAEEYAKGEISYPLDRESMEMLKKDEQRLVDYDSHSVCIKFDLGDDLTLWVRKTPPDDAKESTISPEPAV